MDDEDYEISEEFMQQLTEKYADIEHPLFMDELPADISSNEDLEALHKLLSEGETRDSIAQKYKEVGNEYVNEGKRFYEAAINSYTNGILAESKDNVLNSQLYSNRALVHLRLGDNVKCVNDCRHSIKHDKYNYKSYYRGAQASFNISLYKQALVFCNECAKVIVTDPNMKVFESEKRDNFKLLSLVDENFGQFYKKILNKYEVYENEKKLKNMKELEEKQSVKKLESDLLVFLKSKGIKFGGILYGIPESQNVVFYLRDGNIHTSCLFVYDEKNLSDYIQDFDYSTCVFDHLQVMFSDNDDFNFRNCYCYYQVSNDEVLEFDVNQDLQSVAFNSHVVFKVAVVHIVNDKDALTGFTKL